MQRSQSASFVEYPYEAILYGRAMQVAIGKYSRNRVCRALCQEPFSGYLYLINSPTKARHAASAAVGGGRRSRRVFSTWHARQSVCRLASAQWSPPRRIGVMWSHSNRPARPHSTQRQPSRSKTARRTAAQRRASRWVWCRLICIAAARFDQPVGILICGSQMLHCLTLSAARCSISRQYFFSTPGHVIIANITVFCAKHRSKVWFMSLSA